MQKARCLLVTALLLGCATGVDTRANPRASVPQLDPTEGYDTGSLATDTSSPTGAWPGARPATNVTQYTRTVDQRRVNTDREITRAIGEHVLEDETISGTRNVVITTHDGVVTIRGSVLNGYDRARVQSAAENTPGVLRVVNELRVTRPDD